MRILIVGGGFAGIKAARTLAKDKRVKVTLVSDREQFEYHAALYRTTTGRSRLEVSVPLADIFPGGSGVELAVDRIEQIDPDDRYVTGSSGRSYHYDQLLLAPGVVTEYYAIRGLADYSYGIKSIDEAMRLKDHLHKELTQGHVPDQDYVVVGGGPTGIELAGELVSYLKQIRANHKRSNAFKVHLVEAAPRLLPALPEDFAAKIQKRLEKLGVEVHLATAVKGETKNQLLLGNGGKIKTHGVIWTAGVTGNPLFTGNAAAFELGRGKRVVVSPTLEARRDIYVLGDSAGTPRSGWGQTALYDGEYVADNILAALDGKPAKPYRPHRPIGAIPVGPGWAAVADGSKRTYGRRGWLLRRRADLRLMMRLLPKRLAMKAWVAGNVREETCPECAPSLLRKVG